MISLYSKPLKKWYRKELLRCPAQRRIPLSQSHHQIEFPPYCYWLGNPSSLKRSTSGNSAEKHDFRRESSCLCREIFVCAVKFLFVPWSFCLCRDSFCLCRDSFCLCREIFVCTVTVFVCAVEFLYVPWHPWATVLYGPAHASSTTQIFVVSYRFLFSLPLLLLQTIWYLLLLMFTLLSQKCSTYYIFLFFDYLIGYLNSIVCTKCFPWWLPTRINNQVLRILRL